MKRTPVLVLFVVITMSGVGVAHSRECAGVSVPDQSQVESSTLVLNGLGLRQATILKVNVYVAALYTAKATSDPNAILGSNTPKQLVLHFVRDVGAARPQQGLGRRLRGKRQGTASGPQATRGDPQELDGGHEDRRASHLHA